MWGKGGIGSKAQFAWTLSFWGLFTICFSSHECRKLQEEIASRTYLQYPVIDLRQQGASHISKTFEGIVFEFLASTIQNTFHYLEHFSLARGEILLCLD